MIADIQKGIRAEGAEERSATLERLVTILETRGHELSADGLDEFADALTQVLRSLPPAYADKSATRLTHALIAQSAARHPPAAWQTLERPVDEIQQPYEAPATQQQQHWLALAQKPQIDAQETHRIVSRGHDAARLAVARNPGAVFARSTLTTLAELAISDLSLKEALVARHDLPEAIGDRLWPYLSARGKVTLLTARRNETLSAARALEIEESDGETASAADIAAGIAKGTSTLAESVHQLTQDGRIAATGLLLARCAGISEACGFHAILSPAERPLVVLLKALGAEPDVLAEIVRLRSRCGIGASKDSRFAAMVMDGIPETEATSLLGLMDERLVDTQLAEKAA